MQMTEKPTETKQNKTKSTGTEKTKPYGHKWEVWEGGLGRGSRPELLVTIFLTSVLALFSNKHPSHGGKMPSSNSKIMTHNPKTSFPSTALGKSHRAESP